MTNTLLDVPCGHSAVITAVKADGPMRARLLDLGFAAGRTVDCLFSSPLGDPRAYRVLGTIIALRAKDARMVEATR